MHHFQMIKQKVLLPENLDQFNLNIGSDWYLSQLIVLLRPIFNGSNKFWLSWAEMSQLKHKILYQLLKILVFDCQNCYFWYSIITLLYYCPIINNFFLSLGIYLSLGISLSWSFVIVSKLICGEFLEIFLILLAVLLPIKSPVSFPFFELLFLK